MLRSHQVIFMLTKTRSMMLNRFSRLLTVSLLTGGLLLPSALFAQEWISLFNGKSLEGWKASENPDSIKVKDGQIVCVGPRAHLFYVGPVQEANFTNFELRAEVQTFPGANSGIYFHTAYQEKGWPAKGYEVQINNSHKGEGGYTEYKKTGSLYGVRNLYVNLVPDNQWFILHVKVQDRRIQIRVNEALVVDYKEPREAFRGSDRDGRRLSSGTFALQGHDPHSKVLFRNLQVKPLPDGPASEAGSTVPAREPYPELVNYHLSNFPMIDFHGHLKGGLTVNDFMAKTRQTGINYGIAPNCGLGFPITNDHGIYEFVEALRGQPVFKGMQAEGREWVSLFSKEAVAQFDYVFTDSMTFTDDQGRRMRLWIDDEVWVDDKQAFMDMLVKRIVTIFENEPIDIYANSTFLPSVLAAEYDQLWTKERMLKVIDAAVKNEVAIEINDRYQIPSPAFIKLAKSRGVKFSFGTNNTGPDDLGELGYCARMIRECGLTSKDLFMPKPAHHKKIQLGLPKPFAQP